MLAGVGIPFFETHYITFTNVGGAVCPRVNSLYCRVDTTYDTFAPEVQMSWNQAHAPLLIESFPKTPRTQFEAS
jgi:hypothetical protein